MSNLTTGSKLSGVGGSLVIICFFFPWLTASCQSGEKITVSGWNLARGGAVVSSWGNFTRIMSYPTLFITLLAAIITCCMVYFWFASGKRPGVLGTVLQIVLALVAGMITVLVLNAVKTEYQISLDNTGRWGVKPEFALFGTALGLAGILLGGLLSLPELLRSKASQGDESMELIEYDWNSS